MAWDGVPWFVGGSAEHSPEVARLLSYAAFGGAEGIIGPDDLAVREQSVPDDTVQVYPGACAILNRASAQQYQAYAARLPSAESVAISPTDSTGGRSDLIVARVEDPYLSGEPWGNPADPTVGPYIYTRVIPNVPSTTISLQEVEPGQSGIALARIDIPVSTGTIDQSMITPLREVVNPRRQRLVKVWTPVGTGTGLSTSWENFPTAADWNVKVPEWATRAMVKASWGGVMVENGDVIGQARANVGGEISEQTSFNYDAPSSRERFTIMVADDLYLPESIRGAVQSIGAEARKVGGTVTASADIHSSFHLDVEFLEIAD